MLFSSLSFLYWFLPAVLIVYFAVPRRLKNAVLLAASLLFYFYGERAYTVLLLVSSVSDYLFSLCIEKFRGTPRAKAALISSILVNLLMLGFFKYADFFIGTLNAVFGAAIPLTGVSLPLGISFFTFQTMSYTIDVYRGRVRAERNLSTLAAFVCLFPQLVAGPIVRYADIAEELKNRRVTIASAALGTRRFAYGLAKKVLIANTMGELCALFRASNEKTVLFFWLYAFAFVLQIYFDFSGYSDMAIGLGRIFGFTFPENFNYPFMSRSITEFWRRWHMTLGTWFRDYVYFPMGGSRVSKRKWLRNLLAVWLLTGLWHGADWNFILWGLFFGLALMLEKLWLGKLIERAGRAVSHLYVMTLVVFSFVVFNGDGLAGVSADLSGMLGLGGLAFSGTETLYALKSYALPMALAAAGATPLVKRLAERAASSRAGARAFTFLEPLSAAAALLLATACLIDGSFNPFLYFRF